MKRAAPLPRTSPFPTENTMAIELIVLAYGLCACFAGMAFGWWLRGAP